MHHLRNRFKPHLNKTAQKPNNEQNKSHRQKSPNRAISLSNPNRDRYRWWQLNYVSFSLLVIARRFSKNGHVIAIRNWCELKFNRPQGRNGNFVFYEFFWSGDDVGWYWICIHLMIPIRVQFNDSVSFILWRSYHLIRRDIRLSVDSFEIIFSDYEKDWWVWLFIIDFEVDWKLFKIKFFLKIVFNHIIFMIRLLKLWILYIVMTNILFQFVTHQIIFLWIVFFLI